MESKERPTLELDIHDPYLWDSHRWTFMDLPRVNARITILILAIYRAYPEYAETASFTIPMGAQIVFWCNPKM